MHQNCITRIEGLSALQSLDTINLSNNLIKKIENLGDVPSLSTLQLANNQLKHLDDLEGLRECRALTCLDLSNNKIEDPAILDLLQQIPSDLVVLSSFPLNQTIFIL